MGVSENSFCLRLLECASRNVVFHIKLSLTSVILGSALQGFEQWFQCNMCNNHSPARSNFCQNATGYVRLTLQAYQDERISQYCVSYSFIIKTNLIKNIPLFSLRTRLSTYILHLRICLICIKADALIDISYQLSSVCKQFTSPARFYPSNGLRI